MFALIHAVNEVFSELTPKPLGAASLAQVHRARLRKDGREVAVKIQHPDVRKNGYTDLETIDVSELFSELVDTVSNLLLLLSSSWWRVCTGSSLHFVSSGWLMKSDAIFL